MFQPQGFAMFFLGMFFPKRAAELTFLLNLCIYLEAILLERPSLTVK